MPELPEVETIARRLRAGGDGEAPVVGRTVITARVPSARVVLGDKKRFIRALAGRRVVGVRRRAKYLLIDLDSDDVLVVHLRMTGDLHVVPENVEPKFVRWALDLDDRSMLAFTDGRHLGTAELRPRGDEIHVPLGPEPLDGFDAKVLRTAIAGKKAPIKAVLMDQAVIAGVGNIYADEALFDAKIHPSTKAVDLDAKQTAALAKSIVRVLQRSIDVMAGKIAWRYANRSADSPFLVYDHAGDPCVRCKTKLRTTKISGRTTVFCPTCQRG